MKNVKAPPMMAPLTNNECHTRALLLMVLAEIKVTTNPHT